MKLKRVIPLFAAILLLCSGCGAAEEVSVVPEEKQEIVIGFSQVGAESDWRSANTTSMIETFTEENGYRLLIEDGQQKQANQMKALRTFIQQEVDYIVLAPVTETGWDTVLAEVKDANIPVILIDRMVDTENPDLYDCWVGSDFELEAKKVAYWIALFCERKNIPSEALHIVNIQGTLGASAQIDRTKALQEIAKEQKWDIMAEVSADFTQSKGKEVMDQLLEQYPDVNVVYCENDNEALGALEAIKEAGRIPGADILHGEIMVVSFDGVNQKAMQCVKDGEIQCIAECNPLQGERVKTVIELLESGTMPQKLNYVKEEIYAHDSTVDFIAVDGAVYPVTIITSEE